MTRRATWPARSSRGRYCSGGWDYYIEFDPQKRAPFPYRADGRCAQPGTDKSTRPTTLDDNVTQAAMRLLMRVDRELDFSDAAIHDAARFALDSLVKAQHPNGAWPQRYSRFPDPAEYPVKRASYPESWPRTWPGADYYTHYTFNDNSIVDALDAMLEAARIYKEPRYLAAAEKGGEFMLLSQMPEPQPGWAQQYDREMHPAWARQFEPPSITGGESQSVMRALMLLYRETGKQKYLEPLPRALAYYKRSILPEVETPSEIRRRACPGRTPCAARFYELKTNRPLYVTKGTRVTAVGQGVTNVDGYELSYNDQSVITHYAVLTSGAGFADIEKEYKTLLGADAPSLKRPDRLHGLSPWTSTRLLPAGTESAAAEGQALEPRVRAADRVYGCARRLGRRRGDRQSRPPGIGAGRPRSRGDAGRKDIDDERERDAGGVLGAGAAEAADHPVAHVRRQRRRAQCLSREARPVGDVEPSG